MPSLTGDRLENKAFLQALRRDKVISQQEYRSALNRLFKQEQQFEKQEAKRRAEEAVAKARAKREAFEAKLKAKKEKKTIENSLITSVVVGDDVEETVWSLFKQLSGQTVRLVFGDEDDVVTVSGAYKEVFRHLFKVAGTDSDWIIGSGDKITVVRPSNIPVARIRQVFRDGISHCVFTPILNRMTEKMNEAGTESTKKRYKQRINRLLDLLGEYEAGVPEEKMEEVCKASGLAVVINDFLGQKIMSFNDEGKVGTLHLTNTRENHLDTGRLVLSNDYEEISPENMRELWLDASSKKKWFHIEGDLKNDAPTKLLFLDKCYKVKNPVNEACKQFNKEIGIDKYRLNATAYPDLNAFMKAGRLVNSTPALLNDAEPTGHIDMPKAYTQFKKCKYYSGFLGMIHQYRSGDFDRQWLIDHIGMYQFRIMGGGNEVLKMLGIRMFESYILPSMEILYYMDLGIQVQIYNGAWGSRFDFDYPDYMLENRHYAIWAGKLGMDRETKAYTFPGNKKFAGHLQAENPDYKVFHWPDKELITVRVPVKNRYTLHHIFAFLTSYTRIQMIETMMKFKIENLCKVVMDGLYYRGEQPAGVEWFHQNKEMKHHSYFKEWFEPSSLVVNWKPMKYARNTFIAGQGGAGKTYGILTDSGYNKTLYVCPQHILGQRVYEKYGTSYTTINKLIGAEMTIGNKKVACRPFHEDKYYPPVIVIDEATQIEASWIEKALSMYKESLIFIVGDIDKDGMWYQTRNGSGSRYSQVWKPVGMDYVVVEGDRRSRDDKLKELKIQIRSKMREVFLDGNGAENVLMVNWAKTFPTVSFDDAVAQFCVGDTWIAGTHKINQQLLEKGIVSGYYKEGGFISCEEKEGYEKRGSFTIHSYQGSTIESGKIYISLNGLFEFSMFYTAVSRAVHFDQLVFVN